MTDVTINSKQVSTLTIGGNVVYSRWFKPLEYIESSGTQYIKTGYIPTTNTRLTIDFYSQVDTSGAILDVLFGTNKTADPYRSYHASRYDASMTIGLSNSSSVDLASANYPVPTGRFTFVFNDSGNYILKNPDGTTKWTYAGTGVSYDTYELHIFARNNGANKGSYKLYSLKLEDTSTNTVVRNFVPCITASYIPASKDSQGTAREIGVVGLWETVTDTFYANAGTGDFSAPPYIRMQYIQATGTQYINTTYVPNANTQVDTTFKLNSADNVQSIFGVGSYDSSLWRVFYLDTVTSLFRCALGYNNAQVNPASTDTSQHSVTFSGSGSITFDGTTYSSGQSFPGTANNYNLHMFAMIMKGSGASSASVKEKSKCNIYSFKIYENDTLVRNFVPCVLTSAITATQDSQSTARSAGEIGMWDTVTDMFYGNAGTGTFVAG